MSSISVQPTSGSALYTPLKSGGSAIETTPTTEAAKSPSTTHGNASVLSPTPTDTIDPATSQLVIEYRNQTNGTLDYQIPTKVQLRLYQLSQAHVDVPGQTPVSSFSAESAAYA